MLTENKYFFIPYVFFLMIGAVIMLLFPKSELHLFINQHHNTISDTFFKYINYLAEGMFAALVIIAFTFYKFRYSLLLFSSLIFSSIMAQFLKRVIFNEIPRPKAYFEGLAKLHFIEGVQVHSFLSFPSGHASMAFAIFSSLAFIVKNHMAKMLLLLLAIIVSWSRVHLSQHFFIDIYFGSLLGVVCTLIIFWFFDYKVKTTSLDSSIVTYLKKNKK